MFVDEKYVNDEDVIKARYLISSELFNDALNILENAIAKDPENVEAFYERGRANYFLKDYSQVIMDMNETLTRNIMHPGAYFTRALAYKKNRQYELAYIDDCSYLQIKPSDPNGYNNRGVTLGHLNRQVEAIKDFEKCLELNPEHSMALKSKADKEYDLGRFTDSINSFSEFIEKHDPNSVAKKLEIIEAHLCLGNIRAAEVILKEIKETCPDRYMIIWKIFNVIVEYASKRVDRSSVDLIRAQLKKISEKIPWLFDTYIKYFPLNKYPRWRGPRILKLLKFAETKGVNRSESRLTLFQSEVVANDNNTVTCPSCENIHSLTHSFTLHEIPDWVEFSDRDTSELILHCPSCQTTIRINKFDRSDYQYLDLNTVIAEVDINQLPYRAHTKANIEAILNLFSSTDLDQEILPLSPSGTRIDRGTYNSTVKYLKKHPNNSYPDAVALNFFEFASSFISTVEVHSIFDQLERRMRADTPRYRCPICDEFSESSSWCSECGNEI